jgi:hypothetical protein
MLIQYIRSYPTHLQAISPSANSGRAMLRKLGFMLQKIGFLLQKTFTLLSCQKLEQKPGQNM